MKYWECFKYFIAAKLYIFNIRRKFSKTLKFYDVVGIVLKQNQIYLCIDTFDIFIVKTNFLKIL